MASDNDLTKALFNQQPIQLRDWGFNLIPVKEKKPLIDWQQYQQLPTGTEIERWSTEFSGCEWGIITGPISKILVLDIDGEEGRKALEELHIQMPKTWVTKTRKGWHYYFKWEDELSGVPTTKVRLFNGVDIRGNGGYVVAYNFIQGYSPADLPIAEIPEWLRSAITATPLAEKTYKPGWILEALSNIQPGDAGAGRTHTFARIIGRLNRDGWSEEDIFALLKPHADQYNYDLKKLYEQIGDMTNRYADQSKAQEYVGMSASQLLAHGNPNLDWTIAHVLPKGGIGIFASQPGYGKSWLLLDISTDLSVGRPWLGRYEMLSGNVMYVDEESQPNLLRYRLRKLLNAKGISSDQLRIDFYIGEGLSLSDARSVEKFRTKIETTKPSLIVIDSLIRVHKAEEKSATELAQMFAVVRSFTRDYGCSVLFADHLRKPSPFSTSPENELRGSTEKLAAIDSAFILGRIGESLHFEQIKARYTEPIKSFECKIVDTAIDATEVKYIG